MEERKRMIYNFGGTFKLYFILIPSSNYVAVIFLYAKSILSGTRQKFIACQVYISFILCTALSFVDHFESRLLLCTV